ncbi:MAG: xanthine dehydrogenase family protein subunit M [Ilumatobacteraceae bacterium]
MQTPPPFEYERASSVEQAIALLERLGPEARLVAGGHSLLPMMKLRLARPEHLIDINPLVDQLAYIRLEDHELRIGAMTRHADLLASAVAGEHFRILHDAERVIADPIVRNRGTVGGSLCQADPSEDLSAVFAAIGASVVIASSGGERVVSAWELHDGPYETVVGDAEMLTEVRVPIRPGCGSAYEKVERRVGDWAVAAAGACVWLAGDTVSDVGIGLTAVGAPHFCSPAAEQALRGKPATDDNIAAAAAAVREECNPVSDQRGPAEYKRHLAGELTARALRTAIERARGAAS